MSDSVVNQSDESRYAILREGELLGFAEYRIRGGDIVFTHTEILEDKREKGLGATLVAGALDHVRDETDYRVVAKCPFVVHFLSEHDDYAALQER